MAQMKIYTCNGRDYWFEEGKQPEGFVEKFKAKKPANKAQKPANK